jgi:hypothetical protein
MEDLVVVMAEWYRHIEDQAYQCTVKALEYMKPRDGEALAFSKAAAQPHA